MLLNPVFKEKRDKKSERQESRGKTAALNEKRTVECPVSWLLFLESFLHPDAELMKRVSALGS